MKRRTVHRLSSGLCAFLVLIAAPYGSADHVPLVDETLDRPYREDFNDGPAWTSAKPPPQLFPPASTWAHGTPTSGPKVAHSGTKVWATNLNGAYSNNECGALLSPPIDLTGAATASVSFMQWRHMEEATTTTGSAFDAGMLFASADGGVTWQVVTPSGGYTSKPIGLAARTCLDMRPTGTRGFSGPGGTTPPAPTYTPISADLSAFAGSTIQFAIAFASDGLTARHGWYVDDFAVTVNGATTTETFESGNGGFTIVSTKKPLIPQGWSHGVPTNGPAGSSEIDPPLWATNLTGNHGPKECSWIESPAVKVGALPVAPDVEDVVVTRATLTWRQWFNSSSVTAGGVVQIGQNGSYENLIPEGGYPADPTGALDACLKDDTQASGAFGGALDGTGDEMQTISADLTPYIGRTITVRFLFASTESTTTAEGWYVDDVDIEVRARALYGTHVEPPQELPFTPVAPLYAESFEDGPSGYMVGGVTTWEHGVASAPPSALAGQGPLLWGTNLDGSYAASECGYLQSPPIDLSATDGNDLGPAVRARLSFKHWLESERSFDGGIVQLSTDGETWTTVTPVGGYDDVVFVAAAACLGLTPSNDEIFTSRTMPTPADGWTVEQFDVTSLLGSQLHVRWAFASDASVSLRGWYIDDVRVDLGVYAPMPSPSHQPGARIAR